MTPSLTLPAVKHLEEQVMLIYRHAKNLDELTTESASLWDWAAKSLDLPLEKIRSDVANHYTDEQFSDHFHEEKDHLLKLPLYLLEHLNKHA
jgi:hypothetical protein